MATTPNLGYGKQSEATINQVNQWMRAQPWWNQIRGNNTGDLTESQRQQILRAAQANGVIVDEGDMEVDKGGNFNPKGHKLRNTLVVAGIAGATIATMGAAGAFSGAAAGGGSAAAGGGGAAAGGAGAIAPSTLAAVHAVEAGVPITGSTLGSVAAAAGTKGLSYSDLLKYGAPVAGNLVGGIIQANAEGKASAAQQAYLEEALAYEKEKDAYQRKIDAEAVAREEGRYGAYQGRIAPFIANGTSSNDRMAALLGLPARAGGSSSGGGTDMTGDPKSYADRLSAADKLKVDELLKASNSSDDKEYWYGVNAMHGGFDATGADWNKQRISTGDGAGKGYKGSTVQTPGAPVSTAAPTAPAVSMRAPDGSVKQVPADQVQHYVGLGATVLQGAA
jgi:hypothetical protein